MVEGEEEEEAFCRLKRRPAERPVLTLYDRNAQTEVHTDASQSGLGGLVMKEQIDGRTTPVIYVSRQTSRAEQVYHS